MRWQRKVVHITTVHPPFDTRIFHKQAKTLVKAGVDVALIAPHEKDEVVDGVRIIALPTPRSRIERIFRLTWQALHLAWREECDVYHFHDPELLPVGVALKCIQKKKKVVYDVHEDVPRQILSKYWIPRLLRPLFARVVATAETLGTKLLDGIVAATPAIARRFPPNKTVTVQNFPVINEFDSVAHIPYEERPPNVIYVGGITAIRGAFEMVQAMELLPSHYKAKLILVGEFNPLSLKDTVSRLEGWKRVQFLGWQSREQVVRWLGKARLGLVVLHPTSNYIDAWPVKLFEYMAAGIPVVASEFPLWRQIVEGAGCGLLVDPLNPRAVAEAIAWLLEHPQEARVMGERGRQAVLEKYNWDQEAKKLIELYKKGSNSSRSSSSVHQSSRGFPGAASYPGGERGSGPHRPALRR